jgi:hypothetical protein
VLLRADSEKTNEFRLSTKDTEKSCALLASPAHFAIQDDNGRGSVICFRARHEK